MEKTEQEIRNKKAARIMRIYNWSRFILLIIFIALLYFGINKVS